MGRGSCSSRSPRSSSSSWSSAPRSTRRRPIGGLRDRVRRGGRHPRDRPAHRRLDEPGAVVRSGGRERDLRGAGHLLDRPDRRRVVAALLYDPLFLRRGRGAGGPGAVSPTADAGQARCARSTGIGRARRPAPTSPVWALRPPSAPPPGAAARARARPSRPLAGPLSPASSRPDWTCAGTRTSAALRRRPPDRRHRRGPRCPAPYPWPPGPGTTASTSPPRRSGCLRVRRAPHGRVLDARPGFEAMAVMSAT